MHIYVSNVFHITLVFHMLFLPGNSASTTSISLSASAFCFLRYHANTFVATIFNTHFSVYRAWLVVDDIFFSHSPFLVLVC